MSRPEEVSRALETYDHLLWEAIIRVCGLAFSKAFGREGNQVRVVYQTHDPDFPGIGQSVDPCAEFSRIKSFVDELASSALPVIKLGRASRPFHVAAGLCTHASYQHFLLFGILSEIDRIEILGRGSAGYPVSCDFVEIGRRDGKEHICCPCVGDHLASTRDFQGFVVNLSVPKRVGRDTYEFRFAVG